MGPAWSAQGSGFGRASSAVLNRILDGDPGDGLGDKHLRTSPGSTTPPALPQSRAV